MNTIESFEHNGFTCEIVVDEDPMSPRDWDNFATLVCTHHRRYKLGDKQIHLASVRDVVRHARDHGDRVVAVLPLYLYDHSGITMSTTPFSCRWDSGQVGWAYVTRASAEKMGCPLGGEYKDHESGEIKRFDRAYFEGIIRQEVEAYDQYIRGGVYGIRVLDEDGDELDSCWGLYGEIDYARSEVRAMADHAKRPGETTSTCNATCND